MLHPDDQGALHVAGLAGHDALGRESRRPRDPGDHAAPRGLEAAGPLLEQCLPQVTRRNADVLPEGEQLGLGEALPDVVLPRLQLGRALNDPLQRVAADELAGHRYASVLVFAGGAGSASPATLAVSWGGWAAAACWATEPRNPRNRSSGIGKIVVELFSDAISVTVWR